MEGRSLHEAEGSASTRPRQDGLRGAREWALRNPGCQWLACAALLLAALTLQGCATQYGQVGISGGYIDKIIDEDVALVVVAGNGFTSPSRVQAMVMLRAAELTIQQGHQRFSLFTIEDQAALDAQRAGRLAAYLRQKAAENDGPRLMTLRTTVFNAVAGRRRHQEVGRRNFVLMFKGVGRGAYDARTLVAELRPKLVEGEGN